MYRRVLAVVVVAVLMCAGTVLADNDLHDKDVTIGDADNCAGCHRAHTAQASKLLLAGPNQDDFCFTCHDGTSAYTNVVDGVLVGGSPYGVGADDDGNPLKGGGFVNTVMDNDHDGALGPDDPDEGTAATSVHTADGVTAGTMWGSGVRANSEDHEADSLDTYGLSVSLACGDCHNPHGNGNYRLLRSRPNGMDGEDTTAFDVDVTDVADSGPELQNANIVYEITHTGSGYRDMTDYGDEFGGSSIVQLVGSWCSQCHARYWAASGAGSTDPLDGDAVFTYRHYTHGLNGSCLRCHVAHGTSAAMGTYSGAVEYPDASGAEGSALLTGDNRSVCTDPDACHGPGSSWNLTGD